MKLQIQPLSPAAAEFYENHGTYHAGDAGLDLFCIQEQTIEAGATAFIKLGIKCAALTNGKNVSWRLHPRSSISKTGLRLANSIGLIDAGYRGEVMAAVDNIKNEPYTVKPGDRLVQAVGFCGMPTSFEMVESLDATSRGEGGFGSTGTAKGEVVTEKIVGGMDLKVLPLSPESAAFYENHGTYHAGDAGLDLFCVAEQTIEAGATAFIKLGIKCAALQNDENVSWWLFPRSSISKTPLRLCNSTGLIDAGYRGEVMAAVMNTKTEPYTVKPGDRLVQAVAFDGAPVSFTQVESLDATSRGEGGFGSTGAAETTTEAPTPIAATPEAMCLNVLPLNPEAAELYENHGTYHAGDSGLDLFCVRDETIEAGSTVFLKLGIKCAAMHKDINVSWLLPPRSSISKTPLRLANSVGLIDAGYRGELMLAIDNRGTEAHTVKRGDRLAQAVSFDGVAVSFKLVESLDVTSRGDGGFGSTGVAKRAADEPGTPIKRQALGA